MLVLEIPENPNCEAVEMRVFHDLEPPRPIRQVRFERETGRPLWYAVTGWNLDGTTTSALARKVDDSGEGVILLLSGGTAGLRFQPVELESPWSLGQPDQWGLSFALIGDPNDLRAAA